MTLAPVAGRLKLRRNTAPDAWPDLRTVRRLAGLRLNGSVKDSESIPAQSATRVPVNRKKQLTQMSQGPQHAPMGASLSPLPRIALPAAPFNPARFTHTPQ